MAERPNIIYVHSHDTGRYVQPYGHQVLTPNIQLLADQGITFRRAFCTGRDMHQKLVVYETLVADLLERGTYPAYISVSNQHKPYYRLNP